MCTHPDDPPETQRRSVELTVQWAGRCRREFDRLCKGLEPKPLLFGIVQGGSDPALRRECGSRLEEIGFDGYGFGGWPLDSNGSFRPDILRMAADAMPDGKLKYAMGLGRPEEIVRLVDMGYGLFDCVIPTREARHQRLYIWKEDMDNPEGLRAPDAGFYSFLYIMDDIHRREDGPVDSRCDCLLCRRYSRAYLHHLFKVNDPAALRLSTAHNLRFFGRLMELLAHDRRLS
ncbi:MAG: tRNA-guanine transglycosylase, partial [Clostridia bacterium]|nr:tRNA-guanine transglycosylase [Clostridia bacterium]